MNLFKSVFKHDIFCILVLLFILWRNKIIYPYTYFKSYSLTLTMGTFLVMLKIPALIMHQNESFTPSFKIIFLGEPPPPQKNPTTFRTFPQALNSVLDAAKKLCCLHIYNSKAGFASTPLLSSVKMSIGQFSLQVHGSCE